MYHRTLQNEDQKNLESLLYKTTVLQFWFWGLFKKALKQVLNLLHVLVVLAILQISASNTEKTFLKEILLHK